MSRFLAPLAIVVATAAIILCSPGGSEARSGAGAGGVGEEISSVEHTRAILEGRDLEMEDEEDIIEVDDDAVAGKPCAKVRAPAQTFVIFWSFQNTFFKFEL